MEASIRVLAANRPRLLRELVLSTLSEQTGFSSVGEAENEKGVPSHGGGDETRFIPWLPGCGFRTWCVPSGDSCGAPIASADLVHYQVFAGAASAKPSGEQTVNLIGAVGGVAAEDVALNDGDVLTVPQQTRWKDIGATVTLRGEVAKPGVYGIEPGERLSSLLNRAGGMLPSAYPQAAVFERIEVRQMQQQNRQDLIQRLERESTVVKTAVSTSGSEEAALRQAALQQRQRIIDALKRAPVGGRLVVHIRHSQKEFAGSSDDIELRAGDTLEIPKQPGFVLVVGQVYNSNAITYTPGKTRPVSISRGRGDKFGQQKSDFHNPFERRGKQRERGDVVGRSVVDVVSRMEEWIRKRAVEHRTPSLAQATSPCEDRSVSRAEVLREIAREGLRRYRLGV